MINPIMQALNGNRLNPNNGLLSRLQDVKRIMNGQAPEVIYDQLMRTNPQFKQFIDANQGKSPEQLAQEYGIDLNMLKQIFK